MNTSDGTNAVTPSSCKEVDELLARRQSLNFFKSTNPDDRSLFRAYFACQRGLEISPLSSRLANHYVSKEQAAKEREAIAAIKSINP